MIFSIERRKLCRLGVQLLTASLALASNHPCRAATITWTNVAGGNWENAANWSPAQVPGGVDDAVITASGTFTVVMNTGTTVHSLTLGGSTGQQTFSNNSSLNVTFSNPSVVNANGVFAWNGGTVSGGGFTVNGQLLWHSGVFGCPLNIATNAVMNLYGGGNMWLGGTLTNAGTVNWTGGAFQLDPYDYGNSAGPIANLAGGQWNIECDQTLNSRTGPTASTYFLNAGTITKLAGTGQTYVQLPISNTAAINASSGTINFQGGGPITGNYTAAAGSTIAFSSGNFSVGAIPTFSGLGSFQFTGGSLALASGSIPNLQLVGGTVSLGDGFQGGTITNLTLSGSTLAGTNTVSGVMNWVSGIVNGPLSVASTGVLTLSGGGNLWLGSSLTNAGTVNWTGGALQFDPYDYGNSAGPIVNLAGAQWNIECDQSLNSRGGTTSNTYFVNDGTITKLAGTGTTYFDVQFDNDGAVNASSGTINFQDGGPIGAAYNAASGASIVFGNGSFNAGGAPTLGGLGSFQFTGGSLLLGSTIISNLQMVGGTVTLGAGFQGGTITNLTLNGSYLTGTNTVTGVMNWVSGIVTGPLTVASTGVLTLSGGGNMWLGSALTNAGTVNWTGGTLQFDPYDYGNSAGPIVNLAGAQWNIECDQSLNSRGGNAPNTYFINDGTITKLAGTGTTYFYVQLNNAAAVNVSSGTINFQDGGQIGAAYNAASGASVVFGSGSFTVGGAPTLGGLGSFQFTGGSLLLGSTIVSNLQMVGGTVSLSEGFQGGTITNLTLNGSYLTGTNTVTGAMNWVSGVVTGPLTVASTGVLTLSGGGNLWLGSTLTNAGTVNWTGGSFLFDPYDYGNSAGPIVNLAGGQWNIECDQSLNSRGGNAANTYFANDGTITKLAGTGTTYVYVPVDNAGVVNASSGTINFQDGGPIGGAYNSASGASIVFASGSFTVGGVPTLGGSGSFQFTGGSLLLGSTIVSNLQMTGGTVSLGSGFQGGTITNLTLSGSTLAGTNTVSGSMNWMSGVVTGPLAVASTGVLTLSGGGNLWLGSTLTNAGTVNWTGGTFQFDPYDYGNSSGPIVNLAGGQWNIECDQTLSSRGGNAANTYFINNGTMTKLAGTGTTYVNVPFDNAGAVDASSGTINFQDGGPISGTFNAASGTAFVFSGGNFTAGNSPTLAGPGSFQFTGGSLLLGSTIIPNLQMTGGTVNLGAGFQGGTITNLTLSGSTLPGANTVSGAMNWMSGLVPGPLTVASTGVLTISGGGNLWLGSTLTNSGTVNWTGGTLQFDSYDYGNSSGPIVNLAGAQWNIECDQTLNSRGGNTTNTYFLNDGTITKLAGTGSTHLSVALYDSGELDVESGTVSLSGSPAYVQSGATMIFGVASPSSAGHVSISGSVNFDGTLQFNLLSGYAPKLGDSFSPLSYGSETGAFGNLALGELGAGLDWQASYGSGSLTVQVVSNQVVGRITGTVQNSGAQGVSGISVVAFTTNNPDFYVSTVTGNGGNYALNVTNGTWIVGLQNLAAAGYNAVANQTTSISNSTNVVNFSLQPYTGPVYSITTEVNPPGAGTASGGGSFSPGTSVTVNAVANTNALPYQFLNWTADSLVQSTTTNYTFTAAHNEQLVANFVLPLCTITASNNPTGAGSVTGAGTYFYGNTNILTAYPNFGYSFSNWTEGPNIAGTNAILSTVVYTNHSFVANYAAANLIHVVTTATAPAGVATIAGAGSYTNGQTATFVAPLAATNPPNVYYFQQFTVSNTVASTNATFAKTFSTLDPTNLQYVAVYRTVPIVPQVTNVLANFSSPVPATTNFILTLEFDRTMVTNVPPVITLTNSAATLQATVPTNGLWTTTVLSNDTYVTPPITFITGMDGTQKLWVSGAQDTNGNILPLTNVASFLVQATPPPNPVLSLVSSNQSSVTVSWNGYSAPSDLAGFRVFVETTNYSSVASVPIYTGVGASARSFTFGGLALDTPYYLAAQAFDTAGNSLPAVSTLSVLLPTTLPPPVSLQVGSVGASTAQLTWNSYNTSALFGFSGFQVYEAKTNVATVAGLLPLATLPPGTTSCQVPGLDRSRTYYFAVVGYNDTNGFNPEVTTASWSDPYAGNISANTTIGGSGASVVNIYHSMVVTNNAVLTIQPGTTVLFAPGTSLTVAEGQLSANGTALAPIILDSANDTPGNTPAPGDWGGVTLDGAAAESSLNFVEILYGGGLTLNSCAPTVQAFTASFNIAGLTLEKGATLTTSSALISGNSLGVHQTDTAVLTVENSVIQNNTTNGRNAGISPMNVQSNWWGSAVTSGFASSLQGNFTYNPFLTYEPLLTPAIGTVGGATQVGSSNVNLELACRTAESMRISEDINFGGVFFAPFTNTASFQLSAGGGLKRIYAQFRSVTGQTNAPIELDVNYITGGPVIQQFSLSQGQTLNRPLTVTGTATSVIGMADMELYVDGILVGTNAGGTLSQYLDVRTLANAIHEVELVARDTSGNFATLEDEVVVAVTPPPAPVILQPAAGLVTNTNVVTITGAAEPNIGLQITCNGQVLALTNANASGNFVLTNAPLTEGDNLLLAIASDSTGTTPSSPVHVLVETIPPAQLVLAQPVYAPSTGLSVSWTLPSGGKPSVSFVLFWAASPFTSTNQATGSSSPLTTYYDILKGLPSGTYYFGVVGYDAAGNASPLSALVSVAYDATPPALTVAFGSPSPVGPSALTVTLQSSKALAVLPTLTIQPSGATSPVLLSLTNVALNTWQGVFTITPATPSGPAAVIGSAQDLAGNTFNGAPSGPLLVIDTTPPTAAIFTIPVTPIQTTNSTNVTVNLTLTKSVGAGTLPTLVFTPPVGTNVPVTLAGAGSNWNGGLLVTPSMGTGVGHFTFTAQDSLGNVGTNITLGGQLELYDTATAPPPTAPTNLAAVSLAGGYVSLSWNIASNAQIYRVYREAGTNFGQPVLVLDNIVSNGVLDLPPVDGAYSYGVSASRLGSESGVSNVVIGISDRTPPPAPTNVAAALAASGVSITWQEPAGETPDHYVVYRNGVSIASVASIAPVVDFPPTGTNTYIVAAVDAVGNQNASSPAVLTLLVGPVANLSVVQTPGEATVLSWSLSDPKTAGYNLYRNGVKQNTAILTSTKYTDTLPLSDLTQYGVTAVNGSGQESPARLVNVAPVSLGLLVNSGGFGSNGPVSRDYFDQYQAIISNLSSSATLPVSKIQLTRGIHGLQTLVVAQNLSTNLPAGGVMQPLVTVAEPNVLAAQSVELVVSEQTDSEGSSVSYQQNFQFSPSGVAVTEIAVTADALPLAGGLTDFQVQVFNRSYVDMEFIVSRAYGGQPGDFYISVQNSLGQEVSRTPYQGSPPGTTFGPDGSGYVTIGAGSSTSFTVPGVLVPAAMTGATNVTFEAVASVVYSQYGTTNQVAGGPLSGTTVSSSLAVPPYVGTAKTDKSTYVNDTPIQISGQAISTSTGLPVPNAALNIGFGAGGFTWFIPVTTDANGNYQYTFTPPPGFGGNLDIWAANPAIVDQLYQAPVIVYRLYCTPSSGDITMSKNDTVNFSIQLLNPGDVALGGFSVSCAAYQESGTNEVPVNTVSGSSSGASSFALGPGQRQSLEFQLSAGPSAPNTVLVVYTISSAAGASTTFTGTVTLLPAVPLLTVTQPDSGYLQVSVNRGQQLSGQVTVQNTGLKALQGVTLTPPTNVTWMQVNLPVSADGLIHLPDLDVGQTATFGVVFSPPTNAPLAFVQDTITIQGTNSTTSFPVNLYALVTSDLTGAVQFYVNDFLGAVVPNAAVILHNNVLFNQPSTVYTDTNGLVTVTNLQEGTWNWQVNASGCSGAVGTVNIVSDQTAYQPVTMVRSLVSITFSVVPVPFSDVYEIQVNQVFQTHVPGGVLVLDPPTVNFSNTTAGFSANFTVNVENYGLIEMTGVTLQSSQNNGFQVTPLISYIPVILPMQSVSVPFSLTSTNATSSGPGPHEQGDFGPFVPMTGCGNGVPPQVAALMENFVNGSTTCYFGNPYQTAAVVITTCFAQIFGADPLGLVDSAAEGALLGSALSAALQCGALGGGGGEITTSGGGGGGGGGGGADDPDVLPQSGTEEGCFPGDTLVLMADGSSKPISAIRMNDVVRSGPKPGNLAVVRGIYGMTAPRQRQIQFNRSGTNVLRQVAATPEHRFWLDGKGWVSAGKIAVGDWLFVDTGERVEVSAIQDVAAKAQVYTLGLSGDGAFYANGVLVSHLCGKIPGYSALKPLGANQ